MAGYLGFDATDEKPFIFVSYNTEDQVRLSKIAKELRAHQINIWYDNGIHRISDEEWQEQIAIHIREAEIVFFFLTQGIFEKKNSFVKKEYDLATRHAKKICLVMLDEIDPQIIPAKYDFWWGDISNRQSIEAARMSEVQIAEEICKECRRAGPAARRRFRTANFRIASFRIEPAASCPKIIAGSHHRSSRYYTRFAGSVRLSRLKRQRQKRQ